jgi:uncharacterized protein YegL
MTSSTQKENITPTDIIILLDSSGSMTIMGNEPIQSANDFIKNQQQNNQDNSSLTLVSFSSYLTEIINDKPLQEVKEISYDEYRPDGTTSLNDAVCTIISDRIYSEKTNDVIFLIITDGIENSSMDYSREDTKKYIDLAQKKYNWDILFMGANIDAFEEGKTLNINCSQFDQHCPGDLLSMMRTTSERITHYKRAKTDGHENNVLTMPLQSTKSEPVYKTYSHPICNFSLPTLIRSRS